MSKSMNPRLLFWFISVPLMVLVLFSCNKSGIERPNVILIMTDDQGYGDFGLTGNKQLETAALDRLGSSSARMEQFYVSPVCSPTRACLMTGRYNYRTRCIDTWIGRSMMEPDEVTIAEILKDAGYATGIFGKWHLGDHYPMRPQDQGFDEVLVHMGGGIGQPADPPGGEGKYTDPSLMRNGLPVQETGYCTDVYFKRGMEWMEQVSAAGANFFLYLPTNAPHGPFHDVPEELYQKYKNMDLSAAAYKDNEGHEVPEIKNTDRLARIFAMIHNIDDNVGRLMNRLENLQLLENTLVIFLVDNGPSGQRYVSGFRGSKSTVYEGGIRSPLFLHWPSRFSGNMQSDQIAAHIDIMPTIMDACDIEEPEGLKLDGRSMLPMLENPNKSESDRHLVIQSHRGDQPVRYHNFAIRNQRWKMLNASGFGRESLPGEPSFELYDMLNDPLEMSDVAGQNPDIVDQLKKVYGDWFEDVSTERPDNYQPPRIIVGSPEQNPVVLTRQDWRSNTSWGVKNANGFWMLNIVESAEYDVKVRIQEHGGSGKAVMQCGDQRYEQPLELKQRELTFNKIKLPAGDVNLQLDIQTGKKTIGPWQVEVHTL